MAPTARTIYTIGHSNLDPDQFLPLLARAKVETVADVRSLPQSSRFPQFNQSVLEGILGILL